MSRRSMQTTRIWRVAALLAGVGVAAAGCEQYTKDSGTGGGASSSGNVSASSSSSSGSSSSGQTSSSSGSSTSSASSASSSSSGSGPQLSDWEREVLEGLNAVRANASPTPDPALPALVWNESVAAVMRTWAAECKFVPPDVTTSGKIGAGGPPQSAEEAVVRTTDSNFDYAANTCTSGSCNSHRAALSRDVTSVGCAIRDCTGFEPPSGSGPWELWGCVFAPANDPSTRPY